MSELDELRLTNTVWGAEDARIGAPLKPELVAADMGPETGPDDGTSVVVTETDEVALSAGWTGVVGWVVFAALPLPTFRLLLPTAAEALG